MVVSIVYKKGASWIAAASILYTFLIQELVDQQKDVYVLCLEQRRSATQLLEHCIQ